MTWPASARATTYKLRYKKTIDSSWNTDSNWSASRSRTLIELTNGAGYDVQIRANNSAGPSPDWSPTATGTPRNPVKYQGTLTVGGSGARRGYTASMGSLTKTAGTLTITGLTDLRLVRVERTILTLSGSPANSDSTFATLRVGNITLRRSAANYASGTWTWTSSIGLPAVGSTVTVTLQ